MKKYINYILVILLMIIVIKYFVSDYKIEYKINKYKVVEEVSNGYTYITVNYKNKEYPYIIHEDRKMFKKIVKTITYNGECINVKTNEDLGSLCYKGDELISKTNDIEYKESNKEFSYNNNLNNNEYMLIWKYNGFYYICNNEYSSINIFNKDRYSNDLMYQIDKYIILPKYDSEYLFNTFIILDITTGEYEEIETDYSINYDSYYAGTHKNNIYLFDNKNNILYEINYKSNKVKKVGDKINGFIKYDNNKKVSANISEYTKDKITYFNKDNVVSVNNNYYSFNKYNIKYIDEEVKVINNIDNNIYFIYKDNIYKYDSTSIKEVVHYSELTFNSNNIVYIYNK